MAKRRMISVDIFETDQFSTLPKSSQSLYTHMILNADDDGIVDNVESLLRHHKVARKYLDMLVDFGYVFEIAHRIWVITDWRNMNNIRADRYVPTTHRIEYKMIALDENSRYFKL